MVHRRNVIIVAARRSGTHLLADLIVNNFEYESINKNYIDYTKFEHPGLNGFQELMDEGNKVTWTHSHNYKEHYKRKHSIDIGIDEKLDKIFSESKIILIYRDIRDIITSCYHRPHIQKKYNSFSHFYKNFDFDGYESLNINYDSLGDLLIDYYKNWFSVYMSRELLNLDMEIISFEDIINNYKSSVEKIGKFLEVPIHKNIDIRLPKKDTSDIKFTTNDFRSGKIGEWRSTMNDRLGKKLGDKYHTDVGRSVQCYLEDIKIHEFHSPERNKFQIGSTNWTEEIKKINTELSKYEFTSKLNSKELIKNRYTNSKLTTLQTNGDFRYFHKVFYYKDYVLKFVYPCKAALDKITFNTTVPVASLRQKLIILKTNDILYNLGIVPKLYDVGIYNGVLYIVQERYEGHQVLCAKYNLYPDWDDWEWPVRINVFPQMLKHFNAALEHNIVLTDIVKVYNCAIDDKGNLKYFDLDGIKVYNSRKEMLDSEDYKNAAGIIAKVSYIYNKVNNNNG